MNKDKIIQEIRDSVSYKNMVGFGSYPEAEQYVVTALQAGNIRGEKGLCNYIGYVVQVRKKAGAFGSNAILLRHPNGKLRVHENQSFFRLEGDLLLKAKSIFDDGVTPEDFEDYDEAYEIMGKFPEKGRVVEAKDDGYKGSSTPLMQITTTHKDGSKTLAVV